MKKVWDDDMDKFIEQKNRELEALNLDPKDYQLYVLNERTPAIIIEEASSPILKSNKR
jgi:uncharacterized protein YjiK